MREVHASLMVKVAPISVGACHRTVTDSSSDMALSAENLNRDELIHRYSPQENQQADWYQKRLTKCSYFGRQTFCTTREKFWVREVLLVQRISF